MKKELVDQILELEWEMFSSVEKAGGKAKCQEEKDTFIIMRSSQAITWSEETLESYLNYLKMAKEKGVNLMTEKYARMMSSTMPSEYEKIQHLLPELSDEELYLIDSIVKINLEWREDVVKKYPYIADRGRPTYSSEDTPQATSIETYIRGELSTYSKETLEFYYQDVLKQKENHINGAELILENTMKKYGFESLDSANEFARQKMEASLS